jgi:hypothetical protein
MMSWLDFFKKNENENDGNGFFADRAGMPHARVAAKRCHSAETGGRYAQNSVSFALKPK